ncbi:MAG TPA: hypothetical protein VIF37_18385 [Methylobacter sp.]
MPHLLFELNRAEIAEHFYQLSSIRGGRRYFRREWGQFDATSIDPIARSSVTARVIVEEEKPNSQCTRTAHA